MGVIVTTYADCIKFVSIQNFVSYSNMRNINFNLHYSLKHFLFFRRSLLLYHKHFFQNCYKFCHFTLSSYYDWPFQIYARINNFA